MLLHCCVCSEKLVFQCCAEFAVLCSCLPCCSWPFALHSYSSCAPVPDLAWTTVCLGTCCRNFTFMVFKMYRWSSRHLWPLMQGILVLLCKRPVVLLSVFSFRTDVVVWAAAFVMPVWIMCCFPLCSNGTSMISLIIPPKDQISRVAKMLADEFGTASNIKSRVNRLSVLGAITSVQQRLKLYNKGKCWEIYC